jgi:hypothetical protein
MAIREFFKWLMKPDHRIPDSAKEFRTDEWLQQKSEENWARVPEEKRKLCVEHLRSVLSPVALPDLCEAFEKNDFGPFFHFSGGMGVRNILRDVMKDDELPKVKYDSGYEYSNWDDFYMAALRQAVAPKEGEA